ncbi:MAG: response regulator [Roseburia sp.]|nr:response regulator [Roseburia sp.]MCM1277942.1 response regulator [Robinsoniella sp.]
MKRQKLINITFALLFLVVFCYFILGEWLLPADKQDNAYICTEYSGQWERITASGMREPAEMPGRCEAARNEIVVVETTLPENVGQGRCLCFRSAKQDMRFYIDGQLRQEYSTRERRLFGRVSAAVYVFLELKEEDAGKVLRVETQTDSSYSGIFYTVYYGNPMGIWKHFFKQLGVELVVAFVMLLLSVIAIIGSLILRFYYHRRVSLEYLGLGILMTAVWLITNSTFRQLLFPNLSIINDMTFLMIMLLPLPYLLYMNEIQKDRYRCAYQVLEGIGIVNFFLCCGLHMSGLSDFTDTIIYVSAFCILSIVLLLVTILLDLHKKLIREYTFVAIGMIGVCVAGFAQIIIYFQRIIGFNGVILAAGLIFLLIFSTISTVFEVMDMDREKQRAQQSSESKGRFLANMSHEIRTPIHAVLGMDAMILRESKDPQIREYALDIQNAGQTLLSLINDILDISKIESGKLEILPVEYDFSSLIHDVMNMTVMRAKDKGLTVKLLVDRGLPSRLWGDDVRIRQILMNLLSNAVKYTETGSVTLKVSAVMQGELAKLEFRVEDTGIGIREEDIEKLYHEFERIEEQRNRKIEGTGLGMNITTQLLERMGSRLQVESVYGKGSVFSFILEQKIVSHEPIGDLEARIKNQAETYSYQVMFTAPKAQVLIVDDNAVNRRVFVNLLKATKMQVDEAAGGEECLELVRQKGYDLIFLDHMMPGMDGIEVMHKMREWKEFPCKSTPVIALTANAVTGVREMYLQEGFQDFLSKPVNPEKMEKMIMELLPEEKVKHGDTKAVSFERGMQEAKEPEQPELPELEGIDWNYARLYCRDVAILKDTVKQFYGTMEAEAAQLRNFLEMINKPEERNQGLRHFRIKAHSMKNSSAMVGAVSLAGVARMLEYAARDEMTDTIKNVTPVFLQEWESLREILKPLAEENKPDEKGEEPDYGLTKELLNLLRKTMEEMDVDTADEIIEQLKRFAYPPDIRTEVMDNLCLAVINLDEEQAAVWIDKFEEKLRGRL